MITFNNILEDAGIDLKRARFIRHQDNNARKGSSPYDLWHAHDGRFELYQRIQEQDYFKSCEWLIAFVATPLNETLFVGVYRVRGKADVPPSVVCPARGTAFAKTPVFYDLEIAETLNNYIGRVEINWGAGYRAWIQRPDLRQKPIVAIHRVASEPVFPGFISFKWAIRELSTVPRSWRSALSAVSGVYLLACRTTGKHYVGSATGDGGFWARWENYYRTGHGGNEGMKLASSQDYQVSILEFGPSTLSTDEILQMEGRWKDKLLSRTFGLNRN